MDNSPDFLTHYEMKLSVLYSMVLYCNQTELHSWTKVLGHFCISGAFSNSHRPNLSPHPTKQCWTRASKIFSESKLCMGLKGGRGGGEKCKKISKRKHCFMREPRMTEKYEYCITVPRTFVYDCTGLISR